MKKSALYTRTGDSGTTSLVGGSRAPKHSTQLEAYGTIDELNSHLGLLMAWNELDHHVRDTLLEAQHRLFGIGSHLACDPLGSLQLPSGIDATRIHSLEQEIDHLDSQLPALNNFVLPSGSEGCARAHIARTVCRRAERRVCQLHQEGHPVDPLAIAYINRLSDYLFAVARFNNITHHQSEIFWSKDC